MVQASGDSGDRRLTLGQRLERLRASQCLSEIQERSTAYAAWKAQADAVAAEVEARRVARAADARQQVEAEMRSTWDAQNADIAIVRAENLERYGPERMAYRVERNRAELVKEDRRQRYEREVRRDRRLSVANAGYTAFYAAVGVDPGSYWTSYTDDVDVARIALWTDLGQAVIFGGTVGRIWDKWLAHRESDRYPAVASADHPAIVAAHAAMVAEYHVQAERLRASGTIRPHRNEVARAKSRKTV